MKPLALLATFALLLPAGVARAQSAPAPEDPAHAELRTLRDAMVASFNRTDLDGFLRQLAPEFVSTWQNAAVSRTPAGVRRFFDEMTAGPVQSARVDRLEVDRLASLYGNGQVATALGSMDETFVLKGGKKLTLPCRWTATLTRLDGRWQLAAFHVSTNVFDNPVLVQARAWTAGIAGGIAGVGGLLVGFLVGRAGRGQSFRR